MKKIKIGDKEYEQCETAEDLKIKRFTQLKHYMIYKDTGISVASISHAMQGFVKGFDNESKADMLITLYDYMTGLKQIKDGYDPDQLVFALITYEEGEDISVWDETKGKAKLEKWAEHLDQKTVEESVTNFIHASKAHFVTSFLKSSAKVQK